MARPAPIYQPPHPATERDLDDLPEHVSGQIVDGELIVHPRPDPPHTQAASGLGALLSPPFHYGFGGGPGGWVILDEPKIRFGGNLLVPDLASWRRHRFVPIRKGPYTVAPDWICELLSPSTARIDQVRKLPIYARRKKRKIPSRSGKRRAALGPPPFGQSSTQSFNQSSNKPFACIQSLLSLER